MSDPHQKWTNLGGKKLPTLKGRPSGVQTHQETLFTSPAVVVENAETEESDSDLKSRRKKTRQSFFQKNKGPQLRKRDFKLKVFSRKNMFEGFSFFQYDQYIVNDSTMQKVVVRDQLIIFMDKVNTLKNEIYDDALTQRVITYIAPEELKGLNMKVEEVMSIMNELIKLLLFDIIDELDNIKLSKSPLEPLQAEDPKSEQDLYVQNSHLVKKVLEHFREGVECYMVLCRQSRSNRVLDDINCYLILQFIERGRFGTGMVLQRLRHLKEKQLLNKKNNTKPAETSNDKPEEGTNGADAKEARPVPQDMLAELLKRKFKKQMIVHQTHESKVDLKKETAAGLMNFQKHFEAGNKKPVPRAVQELEREKERAKEKRSIERAMETMGRLEGMPALTKIDMMQKAIADVIPVHPGDPVFLMANRRSGMFSGENLPPYGATSLFLKVESDLTDRKADTLTVSSFVLVLPSARRPASGEAASTCAPRSPMVGPERGFNSLDFAR